MASTSQSDIAKNQISKISFLRSLQAHVFLTFSNHCMKDGCHDEKTFEQEIIALRRRQVAAGFPGDRRRCACQRLHAHAAPHCGGGAPVDALRLSLGGRFAGRTKGRPVNKQAPLRDRLGASALVQGRAPQGKQPAQANPDFFAARR
ncbi:MAG: hypothetical protein RR720_15375 [Comamonas sp.]|uniref:hypothetical protein n=1 Tax=Comamonas sp. TaxID=34028 RepID=UPI002FC94EB4